MAGETTTEQCLIQEHGSVVLRLSAELPLKDNWQHRLAEAPAAGEDVEARGGRLAQI